MFGILKNGEFKVYRIARNLFSGDQQQMPATGNLSCGIRGPAGAGKDGIVASCVRRGKQHDFGERVKKLTAIL